MTPFLNDFGANFGLTWSILAQFLNTFRHQTGYSNRNLDLSKIAFSPRRKHYFSHLRKQNLKKNRSKIASEMALQLISLLVTFFLLKNVMSDPLGHPFWLQNRSKIAPTSIQHRIKSHIKFQHRFSKIFGAILAPGAGETWFSMERKERALI